MTNRIWLAAVYGALLIAALAAPAHAGEDSVDIPLALIDGDGKVKVCFVPVNYEQGLFSGWRPIQPNEVKCPNEGHWKYDPARDLTTVSKLCEQQRNYGTNPSNKEVYAIHLLDPEQHHWLERDWISCARGNEQIVVLAQAPASHGGNVTASAPNMCAQREQCTKIQEALKRIGLFRGPANGSNGELTHRAIAEFQQQRHYRETGEITQPQMEELFAIVETPATPEQSVELVSQKTEAILRKAQIEAHECISPMCASPFRAIEQDAEDIKRLLPRLKAGAKSGRARHLAGSTGRCAARPACKGCRRGVPAFFGRQ